MRRIATEKTHQVLITGGAGFIGTNLAAHLLAGTDARITLFDNLSRPGVALNLAWLKTLCGSGRLRFVRGDVRNAARLLDAARNADEIYHLATPAVDPEADPRADYGVNVTGTINVLEGARRSGKMPAVLFASTGKVYGSLASIPLEQEKTRSEPNVPAFRGISEGTPVDFDCPYSRSRAAADQLVRDYAHAYGLPAVVLRMGCIAGPGQFGNEAQGWVAHFVYSTLARRPVTVYGDGSQIRDVLHVSDLISALRAARAYIGITGGNAFNVGGGLSRSVSVIGMLTLIERVCHQPVECRQEKSRLGDQPIFISDNTAFSNRTGWMPSRSLEQIVRDLAAFWHANRQHIVHSPLAIGGRPVTIAAA